jgi:hypothetical protein
MSAPGQKRKLVRLNGVSGLPRKRTSDGKVGVSAKCRFCCKSRLQGIGSLGLRRGFDAFARRSLRNSNATRYTEPVSVAGVRPALRAAAGFER